MHRATALPAALAALSAIVPPALGDPDCLPTFAGRSEAPLVLFQFGDHLAAVERTGLTTFDARDPLHPVQLARLEFGRLLNLAPATRPVATRSEGAANRVLVTAEDGLSFVVTLDDPTHPEILADGLAISCDRTVGPTAVAEACADGVRLYDLRTPGQAPLVSTIPGPVAGTVAIAGTLLFKNTASQQTCAVFDIEDPAHPVELLTTPYSITSPFLRGDLLFAAGAGFKILSLRFPDAPEVRWTNPATEFVVHGPDLCLTSWNSPLRTLLRYDISDPAHPAPIGEPAAIGDLAAVFPRFVMDAVGPVETTPIITPVPISPRMTGSASSLRFYESLALVASGSTGLRIFDVADPASPVLLSTIDTPGSALDVDASAGYAYVADRTGGLRIIDIRDPRRPSLVMSYQGQTVLTAQVSGDRLVTTAQNGPARIYDLTDPAHPRSGETSVPNSSLTASVLGRRLWASNGSTRAEFETSDVDRLTPVWSERAVSQVLMLRQPFAISRPNQTSIQLLSASAPPATLSTIIFGAPVTTNIEPDSLGRIWFAQASTLTGVDASDPTSPAFCAEFSPGQIIANVRTRGDLLALCYSGAGFQLFRAPQAAPSPRDAGLRFPTGQRVFSRDRIISISRRSLVVHTTHDGADPTFASSLLLPVQPTTLAMIGRNRALVACPTVGLVVVSVEDAANPSIVHTVPWDDFHVSLNVSGTVALVATPRVMTVFDLSNPDRPLPRGHLDGDFQNEARLLVGRRAALVHPLTHAARILDLHDLDAPRLGPAFNLSPFSQSSPVFDGRWLYQPTDQQLLTYDLGDPDRPILAHALDTGIDRLETLAIAGPRLIETAPAGGRPSRVYDLSDPSAPTPLAPWSPGILGGLGAPDSTTEGLIGFPSLGLLLCRLPGPAILDQPRDVDACVGSPAELRLHVAGPAAYQWRRDGWPIAGAAGDTLRFDRLRIGDLAVYDCLITDPAGCGTTLSSPATIRGCRADPNCDGFVDWRDYEAFLRWYESGDPAAEVNGDDFVDFFDYDAFITLLEQGC